MTANRRLQIKLGCGEYVQECEAKAAETFYENELVSWDANGYLVKATDTSGEICVGITKYPSVAVASESSGSRVVEVIRNAVVLLPAVSITQAMVGSDVMEIVDSTNIDDSGGTSNHVKVGRLVRFVSTTLGWVRLGEGV
jgi:hypothetical protein